MTEQEILDNAPEGATHIDIDLTYWDIRACNDNPIVWDDGKWFTTDDIPTAFAMLRSLADIQRIAELENVLVENQLLKGRVAELEKELSTIKDIIVAHQIADETGYIDGIGWVDNWAEMESRMVSLFEAHNLEQQAKGVSQVQILLRNNDWEDGELQLTLASRSIELNIKAKALKEKSDASLQNKR